MKNSHLQTSVSAQAMMTEGNYEDIKENGQINSSPCHNGSNRNETDHNTCKNWNNTGTLNNGTSSTGDAGEHNNIAANDEKTTTCGTRDVQLIYASQEQAIKASFGHEQVIN